MSGSSTQAAILLGCFKPGFILLADQAYGDLLADQAYGDDWSRRDIETKGAAPNIPSKTNCAWQAHFSKRFY